MYHEEQLCDRCYVHIYTCVMRSLQCENCVVSVCMYKLYYVFTCTDGKYENMNNESLHMCMYMYTW